MLTFWQIVGLIAIWHIFTLLFEMLRGFISGILIALSEEAKEKQQNIAELDQLIVQNKKRKRTIGFQTERVES